MLPDEVFSERNDADRSVADEVWPDEMLQNKMSPDDFSICASVDERFKIGRNKNIEYPN